MKKNYLLILLPILLFACRPIGSNTPADTAPAENDNTNEGSASDIPRVATDLPPTATTLPPTWTPVPTGSGAHLSVNPGANDTGFGPDGVATAVPYDGPTTTYTVKRGDTLAEICNKYGVSISEVAEINGITDWDHIEVGQVLILPVAE
ncbi:MAG: LysM domain-containing protein [Anaerolineae bacterium]